MHDDWDQEDLIEVEDPGPEPVEYKPVLVFTALLVLASMVWGWLSHPSHLMLAR